MYNSTKNFFGIFAFLITVLSFQVSYANPYVLYDERGTQAREYDQPVDPSAEVYPAAPNEMTNSGYRAMDSERIDAQELKLQVREIASQLLDVFPGAALQGRIALPASFVDLDDFNSTSALGRYLAEALIYEFNLRGFPVLEYRLDGFIEMNKSGEFALLRDASFSYAASAKRDDLLLVGTYYKDTSSVFVNARLVQTDGLVLRTAQLVLPMRDLLERMTYKPAPPEEPLLSKGMLPIKGR